MSVLPIHVIANGELTRAALNAVVTLLGSSVFFTAIRLSILFAIIGTAVNYVRGKDLAIFAKWFVTYFIVAIIMLGPKVTVQIIDSSTPGASYTVANVPYGLGYPASLITSTSHALVTAFEEAFHMPDDLTYNKTGMLFGSKVFKLSTEVNVVNPMVKIELNEYVKNCVLGDILVTKKYSMTDLTESPDLENLITQGSSSIRGIYVGSVFKTCREAGADIRQHLKEDINQNGFKIFGKQIFSRLKPEVAAQKFRNSLAETYGFFNYASLSNDALQIMTQNILINGIKDGLLNYTAETGATAALLNLSTTQAMERMRMSMATSRNIATYAIPVMHTVLLLLMLSLFPIMALLAFQPAFTSQVLKNYFYTLIWIESWPLMFACLNMVVTFYTKSEIGMGGLTISNINQLTLEHSDVANMAGYMMLSIPFISGGLVMGMASAFNHAAGYIGSVMQSSASSSASEVASGNINLGNTSWANVNANKFDTNTSMMRGMSTEQLGTGVTRTSRPDGQTMYDASHAISKLPTSVKASSVISGSLSEQKDAAMTATINEQKSHDKSISHSASDLKSFSNSLGKSTSLGDNFNTREAASVAKNATSMQSIAENIAKREGIDVDTAFKGLTNFSQKGGAEISGNWTSLPIPAGTGAVQFKGGGDLRAGFEHTRTSESATRHNTGKTFNVTADEIKKFSSDLNKVEEYSKMSHAETSNSEAASHLDQLSTNLNKARSASEQYSVHKAESERLSNAASIVRHHSGQIDSDLGQEIANYVVQKEGASGAENLFAGKDREKLETYAKEYVRSSGVENSIIAKYQQDGYGINPDKKYQAGVGAVDMKGQNETIHALHGEKTQEYKDKATENKVGVDGQEYDKRVARAENKRLYYVDEIAGKKKERNEEYDAIKKETSVDIVGGEAKSKTNAFNFWSSIKPEDPKDKDKNTKEKK